MDTYCKKTISFHNIKDRRIVDHIQTMPNFSDYVRKLILADLDREPAGSAVDLAGVQRIIRAELARALANLSLNAPPIDDAPPADETMVDELEANLLELF